MKLINLNIFILFLLSVLFSSCQDDDLLTVQFPDYIKQENYFSCANNQKISTLTGLRNVKKSGDKYYFFDSEDFIRIQEEGGTERMISDITSSGLNDFEVLNSSVIFCNPMEGVRVYDEEASLVQETNAPCKRVRIYDGEVYVQIATASSGFDRNTIYKYSIEDNALTPFTDGGGFDTFTNGTDPIDFDFRPNGDLYFHTDNHYFIYNTEGQYTGVIKNIITLGVVVSENSEILFEGDDIILIDKSINGDSLRFWRMIDNEGTPILSLPFEARDEHTKRLFERARADVLLHEGTLYMTFWASDFFDDVCIGMAEFNTKPEDGKIDLNDFHFVVDDDIHTRCIRRLTKDREGNIFFLTSEGEAYEAACN